MRAAVEERGVAVVVVPGEIFLQQRRRRRRGRAADRAARVGGAARRRVAAARRPRSLNDADGGHHPRAAPVSRAPMTQWSRLAGDAQRADRACVARQGVHRVRQPVRRRDDRPARLRLRLQGDQGGRRPADARHRLPVPAVLSREREGHPGRHPRRNLGRRAPIDLGLVGSVGDTLAALQPLLRAEAATATISTGRSSTTARPASGSTSWRSTTATARPSDPNTLRGLSTSWPPTTRCSPSTSDRRWSGRPAT